MLYCALLLNKLVEYNIVLLTYFKIENFKKLSIEQEIFTLKLKSEFGIFNITIQFYLNVNIVSCLIKMKIDKICIFYSPDQI